MFSLECKSCGAQLTLESGQQIVTCPYCGSQNTVSKNIESSGNLFNRANYLRRQNEFDRALEVYEQILEKSMFEYEAYWGVILCQYGIEYVEDPHSHKSFPTCHRTQTESILQQEYYKKACQYAPYDVSRIYKSEAEEIDRLQKEILALAQKQEKYDVFICYKETDELGNRTEDSVIAQELYEHLLRRGYRVFFSRKTLEKKLGSAYEPIIFAALNSARVMIVLGLNPNNFSAVWVRNEWSRYLERIKKDSSLALIPAYRGFSPYELPAQFSNLQALDMGKIGFIQELCDGIDRILGQSVIEEKAKAVPTIQVNDKNLIKRGFSLLKDGNFKEAEACFERCLDQNMENAEAYVGKLLIENRMTRIEDLKKLRRSLKDIPNYKNACRFASPQLIKQLQMIAAEVEENVQLNRKKKRKNYRIIAIAAGILIICGSIISALVLPAELKMRKANQLMESGQYQEALTVYMELQGKKGAEEKINAAQMGIYLNGISSDESSEYVEQIIDFNNGHIIDPQVMEMEFQAVDQLIEANEGVLAYELLSSINQNKGITSYDITIEFDYIQRMIANELYKECAQLMAQMDLLQNLPNEYTENIETVLQTLANANQYEAIKTYLTTSTNVTVDLDYWQRESFYCQGIKYMEEKNYKEAIRAFSQNPDYKDTQELVTECYLIMAEDALNSNSLALANSSIWNAQQYDSQKADNWISQNKELIYRAVSRSIQDNNGNFDNAISLLKYIPGYKDVDAYEALASSKNDVNKLKPYIDVDDIKIMILRDLDMAQDFLEGTWTNGNIYFTMQENGNTSYNLPWFDYGDYYSIEDGVLFNYVDGKYETDRRNLFEFTILSWDSISVYCYKDGSTYALYRN